jgi:hypothetical protein
MTRIGKMQPSSRYCSIWARLRIFGMGVTIVVGCGLVVLPGPQADASVIRN